MGTLGTGVKTGAIFIYKRKRSESPYGNSPPFDSHLNYTQ